MPSKVDEEFEFDETVEALSTAVNNDDLRAFALIAANIHKKKRIDVMFSTMRRFADQKILLENLQTLMKENSDLSGI